MRQVGWALCVMVLTLGSLLAIGSAPGCSYGGYVSTGLAVANRHKGGQTDKPRPYFIDVMIDGHEGTRKKTTGDIEIADAVNASPKFKFSVSNPEEFGAITSVIVNIHRYYPDRKDQPFDASYVFALASQDAGKPAFKPDVTYDLSKPIEGVKVVYPANYKGEQDGSIKLPSGSHFCMTVTVQASRAETARVLFETK